MTADTQANGTIGPALENSGPWGDSNDGNKPAGGRTPPEDLDAVLREAHEKFRNRFGRGNGQGGRPVPGDMPPQKALLLLLFVLAFVWLGTGFYRVEPGENAVVLTFGKWTGTKSDPGLGYHLPWPFQGIVKEDVSFDRRLEVGFRDQGASGMRGSVPEESMMLTGDENIIDINFVVLWRINDAGKYLFKIRDPQTTVKKVAESAMREVIGHTPIQNALTEARGQVEAQTRDLMQKILDEYEAGVSVNSVQLLRVDPPAEVVDAFNDVQRARTDKERMRNEAETYSNGILPRARGEAQRTLQDAEAYKQAVIARAEGDAARFVSVYNAYALSKDVTQKRLYLETVEDVLKNSRKIIVGDDKGLPVLPYMQLEQPKAAKPKAKTTAAQE
jgi:membrane protease subunit HflK